ncbi:hypothetical protein AVEN_199523-1 [Araneus ventricosus]|uniref:Uncharacterized protein n=1 Tax=Araneus ventricosus TaxID=182803 RepID=A0A4Y2TSY0_ARAVE|nr:hypothetical protein AVEN_199523-1 [Araneus ventricosus]
MCRYTTRDEQTAEAKKHNRFFKAVNVKRKIPSLMLYSMQIKDLPFESRSTVPNDFDFPTEISGRRFTSNNYTKYLSNGEEINRNWLVYSAAGDSVFCVYFKIFATATSSLAKVAIEIGA